MSQQPKETGDSAETTPGADPGERRSRWSFFEGANGSWTWFVERPEGGSGGSERGFATLKDCIADAERHGYLLPPASSERRARPSRPPSTMISQEIWCPQCKHLRQLTPDEFVSSGDPVQCRNCQASFVASSQNVTCCVEDGEGLRELPLP